MKCDTTARVCIIGARYLNMPRHNTEIEYHPFERTLLRAIPADAPGWESELRLVDAV